MHKVISINLNGNAYQLDEAGYEALRLYLARAAQQLEKNPDRDEIMVDLEQAIADKCQAYLGPHKTVVSTDEVTRIVEEMGPVEGTADEKGASEPSAAGAKSDETRSVPPKRLYRVPAGSMIAGVCTGVAAYFQVDVAVVRAAFIVAGFLTKGIAIIAYVVMMFVIPEASTPEEASGDAPLNAKDVIDRAKRRSSDVGREWRRHWRRQRRDWRRHWPVVAAPFVYGRPPLAAALLVVFGLVNMALLLVMAAMMISLVNTGAILAWQLPPDIPVWAGALALLIAYQIVVSPFRAVRHWNRLPTGGVASAPLAFWSAVASMMGLAFAIWLASNHIPEIREFLQRLPGLFRDFAWTMRDLMSHSR